MKYTMDAEGIDHYLKALKWWHSLTIKERKEAESVWWDIDRCVKPVWSDENLKIIELYDEYLLK